MIGKKKVSEIRENLLKACTQAGIDPATWFDEQIRLAKIESAPNAAEIETLYLVRDGLRASAARKSRPRKRSATR